jgi:hypothetical protein
MENVNIQLVDPPNIQLVNLLKTTIATTNIQLADLRITV